MDRAGSLPVLRSGAEHVVLAVKAQGARVYDVDNSGFIDYLGGGGSAIVGYGNQFVLDEVKKVLVTGVPEGFHVPQEVELAEALDQFLPWVDSWWFCRNPDEAMRRALRWAQRSSGKRQILMLDGGAALRVGARMDGSDGELPVREVRGWDLDRIRATLVAGAKQVAVLVVDPLMSRCGVVPPPEGALLTVREMCGELGVLLLLDERISGFRVGRGGAAAWAGVVPDLAVYGGALGGGFPIGCVAFRKGLAGADELGDEALPVPHPVSLVAADAVLSILKNDTIYERLEERSAQLAEGVLALAERFSRRMAINRVGSAFGLYIGQKPVTDRASAEATDGASYTRLASALLGEGILLPQVPQRTAFVSSAHGAKDVDETLAAFERVLLRMHQEDLP